MNPRSLVHALILSSVLVSVDVNLSKATDSPQQLKDSCENGVASSCFDLGEMYASHSKGVPQDDFEAVALFRKACDYGEAKGCANLGWIMRKGVGSNKTMLNNLIFMGRRAI